jgi:hypothetical protein
MAPGVGQISPEFSNYLDGMAEIDAARCTSRKDADAILALVEPDLGVRQFLLTNLERAGPSDPYKFRLPLKILRDALGVWTALSHSEYQLTICYECRRLDSSRTLQRNDSGIDQPCSLKVSSDVPSLPWSSYHPSVIYMILQAEY